LGSLKKTKSGDLVEYIESLFCIALFSETLLLWTKKYMQYKARIGTKIMD